MKFLSTYAKVVLLEQVPNLYAKFMNIIFRILDLEI
jgi:hypothetical protein